MLGNDDGRVHDRLFTIAGHFRLFLFEPAIEGLPFHLLSAKRLVWVGIAPLDVRNTNDFINIGFLTVARVID